MDFQSTSGPYFKDADWGGAYGKPCTEAALTDEARQQAFDRPPLMKALEGEDIARELQNLVGLSPVYYSVPYYPAKENPNTYRPMIDWERLAGVYGASLQEANSKVRALEDEVATVKSGVAAEFEKRKADRVRLVKANADFYAGAFTLRPGTADSNVNCIVPFSTWEALVEAYKNEVARLTPPAPVEASRSDVLARCLKLDKPLDAYGR